MNKEKQIIEEKKESVRDFYEREIKDTRSIVKELSKITLYGTLTDATGDFADFYIKDIVKVLDKALSSQRKEIVEKIEKIKEIKETKEDKEVHKILIKAGGEQVRGEIIGQRNGYNRALEEIINLIKEDE